MRAWLQWRRRPRPAATVAVLVLALAPAHAGGRTAAAGHPSRPQSTWPRRVVLTNDDGVESPGLRALARAFARAAETWVVAPAADRSGSTNYSRALAERRIAVERRDLVTGVRAYAVDGFPADAVIVALRSELLSGPPDLVISGINVGPNLATDWAYSGTIGAARTAALLGVRALAVSGLEPTDSVTAAAIADWIVALAASPIVRELEPGQYLTVSFPRRPAGEIGGPDVTRRGGPRWSFELRSNVDASTDGRRVYDLHLPEAEVPTAEGTDVAAYGAGRIAIVGMRVDEQDPELQRRLVAQHGALPGWPARQR